MAEKRRGGEGSRETERRRRERGSRGREGGLREGGKGRAAIASPKIFWPRTNDSLK